MFRTNDVKGGINEFEMSGSKVEEKNFFSSTSKHFGIVSPNVLVFQVITLRN
jgi:hypothetical protein